MKQKHFKKMYYVCERTYAMVPVGRPGDSFVRSLSPPLTPEERSQAFMAGAFISELALWPKCTLKLNVSVIKCTRLCMHSDQKRVLALVTL